MRAKSYPKHKPSGVEWLGDVPEHWEVKALKWETPVFRGASPRPIDDPVYFDQEGEHAWVRISDVTSAGMYLDRTEETLSALGSSLSVKMQPGSLFLSIAGSVGKPCLTRIKCCIHDGFVYFPRFRGDQRFLYYVFASGEPYKGLGKFGTQLNLNTDTVGSIVIGFPDHNEQRAIADFLDRETERIDRLVAKKRKLIEKLKEKRAALISRTVTRGLNPDAKLKSSGIEWLGDVPEHWEVKKLGYGARLQGGYAYASDEFESEGVPVVRMNNIKRGVLDLSGAGRIAPEDCLTEFALTEGDLLLGMSGSIGATGSLGNFARVRAADLPAQLNQRVGRFCVQEETFSANFLVYIIQTNLFYDQILLKATGTAQFNVSAEQVESARVPFPPLPEQRAIAGFLDRETAMIDRLETKVEAAMERLLEYRTALITAAVTGKMDVRDCARHRRAGGGYGRDAGIPHERANLCTGRRRHCGVRVTATGACGRQGWN